MILKYEDESRQVHSSFFRGKYAAVYDVSVSTVRHLIATGVSFADARYAAHMARQYVTTIWR